LIVTPVPTGMAVALPCNFNAFGDPTLSTETQSPATPADDTKPVRELKKLPVLFSKTQEIIAQIEKLLEGSLLTYWNSPSSSICQHDVVGFYELLRSTGMRDQAYLLIKSGGGDGRASLRIVHVLRQFTRQLIALVPQEWASAGTMLALGADEIHMGPLAYLTAIDTSIRHYYQNDKDWHYRKEERRGASLNDKSSWRKMEGAGDEVRDSSFHIR
jgi:hypothetical protein